MTTHNERVEAAVRFEWQAIVHRRRLHRRAIWLGAGSLASAAIVALIVQSQIRPVASNPSGANAVLTIDPRTQRHEGSRFRASDEDREPDGGLPRRVLASYSWESR